MIDHTGVNVRNYETSRAFYQQALAPLGYAMLMEFEEAAGFGVEGQPDFWIEGDAKVGDGLHTHVAFRADSRHAVDEFYRAAVKAGGKDNGAPGLRSDYAPDYYAAYVLDPDGNNVEAVCHC
jgi:catechol 2,3-dioxygenase-like lactoylglutathione lyase family enzyme